MASNYSGKFVRVRNNWLPAPTHYKMTSTTLVDSARNADGVVVGAVVRSGIRKIEMTWNFLDQTQFSYVASLFEGDDRFYNSVYYFDTILDDYDTKQMYVGDRVSDTAEIVAEYTNTGVITEIKGYKNVKLSLIEV